jgi:hypothetical protein
MMKIDGFGYTLGASSQNQLVTLLFSLTMKKRNKDFESLV